MHVSSLYRYPVKSMRGIALEKALIEPIGLAGDRRWMVVDERGRFVTRREAPAMAQIEAFEVPEGMLLRHPGQGELVVKTPDAPLADVTIWKDALSIPAAGSEATEFLSAIVGRPVRLTHKPDSIPRPVDMTYGAAGEEVGLADGFPILVTTEESLAALNGQLDHTVTMTRFRPNIVLSGTSEAWAEDCWKRIRIGGLVLRIVKPCARCIIVTQDPETGERHHGNEPINTLRQMGRQATNGIIFGQNAIPETRAEIAVGDEVEILEEGETNLVPLKKR
ncbi:MOSC domain-containing protein [Gimibacter soli]|uniref:MOSC domain-containing protein n=1 Tax=Gimibacter soli TaxID=3024400 RepID=A0AAE9XSJ6_9PROT|nr:MOSC domain-containing protein [Gimibacter soli]WCL53270.1 MOSC domain-containing protein [Gimibacter soli]